MDNEKTAGSDFSAMRSIRGRSVRERFEEKFVKGAGCWEWLGSKVSGYGQLMVNNRPLRAHRLAYEYAHGPIPKGMFICHTCDNPSCVNPAHLFAGTHVENMADCVKKGRAKSPNKGTRGEKNPESKLTAEEVSEIRRLAAVPRSNARVGRQFGITGTHVARICKRESWSHV